VNNATHRVDKAAGQNGQNIHVFYPFLPTALPTLCSQMLIFKYNNKIYKNIK